MELAAIHNHLLPLNPENPSCTYGLLMLITKSNNYFELNGSRWTGMKVVLLGAISSNLSLRPSSKPWRELWCSCSVKKDQLIDSNISAHLSLCSSFVINIMLGWCNWHLHLGDPCGLATPFCLQGHHPAGDYPTFRPSTLASSGSASLRRGTLDFSG